MGLFTGKTVIVTGGGKATLKDGSAGSIGYGIDIAFAKEGANLVITGRNVAKLEAAKESLEAEYGVKVLPVQADVSAGQDNEAVVQNVIDKAIEEFGRIDAVVNNAQAKVYTSTMTYEILLIVVIGGIGSVSGSCIASFLYIACSEWWLRFLDNEAYIGAFKVPLLRNGFRMVVFSVIIMIVVLFFRKGIMGERELPDLFRKRAKKAKKNVVEEGKADE